MRKYLASNTMYVSVFVSVYVCVCIRLCVCASVYQVHVYRYTKGGVEGRYGECHATFFDGTELQ